MGNTEEASNGSFKRVLLGRNDPEVGRLGVAAEYGVPETTLEWAFERGVDYLFWGSKRGDSSFMLDHSVLLVNPAGGKGGTLLALVLVAFATRHGSTQEVAEAVAATLRERRLEVDLRPAREVRSLESYSAVVLGTALYMFRLHKDARRFLSRHREALAKRPVAIFAMGPFNNDEKEWQGVRTQLDRELAQFPWFTPVVREVFGGKFDPAKLRFPYNLVPYLKRLPPSDIRDWKAIHTWASSLADKFRRT